MRKRVMGGNHVIVWELALVVGAVVAFAVWQFVSLKRDGEALRRKRELEASDPHKRHNDH